MLFFVYASVNIAMTIELAPVVGIPLPLLSYGGSSLLGTSINIAIIIILTKKTFNTTMNAESSLDITSFKS